LESPLREVPLYTEFRLP